MSQLIVNQKHVDSMAKRFTDVLADVTAAVDDVQQMLNTSNEPNVEARDTLFPFVKSAEKLAHAVEQLATLTVTKRIQLAMQTAIDSDIPEHKTMAAVSHVLRHALTMNAQGMAITLMDNGPLAFAFRSSVVEQLANAVGLCDVLQAAHEATEKLCADNGIDYAAVTAGDKSAIEALVRVVERTAGAPVPGLRERMGLDPLPEPVQPPDFSALNPASDAALASVLGLEGSAQGLAESGPTSIRA